MKHKAIAAFECVAVVMLFVAAWVLLNSCAFETEPECSFPDAPLSVRFTTVSNTCPELDDMPKLSWLARPPAGCTQDIVYGPYCAPRVSRECDVGLRTLWVLERDVLGHYAGQLQVTGSCYALFNVELMEL